MDWLIVTLISSVFLGLINISDKIVLSRYIRNPFTLIVLVGITDAIVGFFILAFSGIPSEANIFNNLAAISSGACGAFAVILLQRTLYTEEVSRVVPITQTSPIFAALLALFVLSESITVTQWIGIITAVFGGVLISLKLDNDTSKIFLNKSFYSLMLSAMFFGAANVTGKLAVDEMSVLYSQGLRNITFGFILVSFALKSEVITEVKTLFRERSPALTLIMINQGFTAQVGSFMLLWALSLGPASLVATVSASRVIFSFIFAIGLSKIWAGILREDTSNQSVLIKLLSTGLIVAGIVAISI